jgi:hypothetical protein
MSLSTEDIDAIADAVAKKLPKPDPFVPQRIKGNQSAARYVGYKDPDAFLRWAERKRIFPQNEDGVNFWIVKHLRKAMNLRG